MCEEEGEAVPDEGEGPRGAAEDELVVGELQAHQAVEQLQPVPGRQLLRPQQLLYRPSCKHYILQQLYRPSCKHIYCGFVNTTFSLDTSETLICKKKPLT